MLIFIFHELFHLIFHHLGTKYFSQISWLTVRPQHLVDIFLSALSNTVLSDNNGAQFILRVLFTQQTIKTDSISLTALVSDPAICSESSDSRISPPLLAKHGLQLRLFKAQICQVTTSFCNFQRLPTVQLKARIFKLESEASTLWFWSTFKTHHSFLKSSWTTLFTTP